MPLATFCPGASLQRADRHQRGQFAGPAMPRSGSRLVVAAGVPASIARRHPLPESLGGGDSVCLQKTASARAALLVMIHPKVHLRIPCYDFYFLYSGQFAHLLGAPRAGPKTRLRDQSEELINWSDR